MSSQIFTVPESIEWKQAYLADHSGEGSNPRRHLDP
jgi:hypothetical protein